MQQIFIKATCDQVIFQVVEIWGLSVIFPVCSEPEI